MDQIREEINSYFERNAILETKPSIWWDVFKAVIRGKLMNLNALLKKQTNEKLQQLQSDIEKIEKVLKRRPGKKSLKKQRNLLRQQIASFETQEMIWTDSKEGPAKIL